MVRQPGFKRLCRFTSTAVTHLCNYHVQSWTTIFDHQVDNFSPMQLTGYFHDLIASHS